MNEETTKATMPIEIEGVHGYTDSEGTVHIKLADVARGLGFTQTETKNGVEYNSIRWARVRENLRQINFRPLVVENISAPLEVAQSRHEIILALSDEQIKDCFIPEYTFYRLAMKANNEVANAFQNKIAVEILPAIRKHGAYMTAEALSKAKVDPNYVAELIAKLEAEQERNGNLEGELAELKQTNVEYRDRLFEAFDKFEELYAEHKSLYEHYDNLYEHYDNLYENYARLYEMMKRELAKKKAARPSGRLIPITEIAAEYGLHAQTLNQILKYFGVQDKVYGLWMLAKEYEGQGYTRTEPFVKNGELRLHMYWTERGREFLHNFLRQRDIYPRNDEEMSDEED